MDIENSLKSLIHREMRARFIWHHIEKFEKDGSGYSFVVAVRSHFREYDSAANLVSAIKKLFKDVHLVHTAKYSTLGNENIFAMSISCHNPKIVALPVRQPAGDSRRAA